MAFSLGRMATDFGRVLRGNPLDNPATPLSAPAAWLYDLFSGGPSSAGVAVNETTALQHAAVFACVNVISSDLGSLPAKVYEKKAGGKEEAVDSDLWKLLCVAPNPEMSAPKFWRTLSACTVLTGNGYAEIQRDGTKPVALWPLHPRFVKPVRKNNELQYEVNVEGTTRTVAARNMLHITGLSFDGMVGMSPIMAAKQTIGKALALDKFSGGFFGRGSRPSGILTLPTAMAPDQRAQAKESWEKANSGDSQGRTAVLPGDWKWTALSITPEEAQFLETMGYTRTEIAGLFRVPPHQIGDTSRLSNSNHESQSIEYVKFSLRPLAVGIEAEVTLKLLPRIGSKASAYSFAFDFTDLERGDFGSLIEGLAVASQWGAVTINEFRAKLGLNPIGPKGDVHLVPLNMVLLDNVGKEPEPAGGAGDGAEPGTQEPEPAGNGGRNQRMLLTRMEQAFGGLFRDAAGRLAARDKRDSAAVDQIFGPVLEAIAGEARRQAAQTFRLQADAELGQDKLLRDTARSIEKRAAAWTATTVQDEAAAELTRAVRSITLATFREAGSVVALAA